MCGECWAWHTLQRCDIWPPCFPWEVSVPACNNRCWRPLSQVSYPDPFFNTNYWLCWQEWWIPWKTRWFAFHVFVLVGKCLCLNVVPASNAPSRPCHILFLFVSLNIFTAVHGSAFLGHFPQLQSNFDTSTSGDGAESSRLVLFDVLMNII